MMKKFLSTSLINKLVAAFLVSGVAFTAYFLISDGNVSSDDINKIFDEALQEDAELVTKLCEQNLNETLLTQDFLQNISNSNITVDNDALAQVVKRCEEILGSSDVQDYLNPECDETLSKEYSNDPSQVTVTVVEATLLQFGEEYQGILLCWEPMLVDNVEPEEYVITFGYTLDEYIYNDSKYENGIIFSVGTASGYFDDPLLTKYFFDSEYFFDETSEEFVKNGNLLIYFYISAYNDKTDNYYSNDTATVSFTINQPND
ncbi:MAG: hypothetical protein O3A49_06340 [Candidatus Marinimicrobia bacterium]|nr:hypothetical protein [Candidatus Neomarinimicrobiota bacterium]